MQNNYPTSVTVNTYLYTVHVRNILHKIFIILQTENNSFVMARQPVVGQGLLIIKGSRSHSDTLLSVGFLCPSDQTDTAVST